MVLMWHYIIFYENLSGKENIPVKYHNDELSVFYGIQSLVTQECLGSYPVHIFHRDLPEF